jgi:GNAT superfamily N-acetyltransferase
MANVKGIFISAKELSKGVVRRFYDALEQGAIVKESLPDDDESFGNDGIALMLGAELRGLYTYKAFASLQAGTTLYYPYGGMLVEDRYTSRHQALIEGLANKLKTDSKVQIIMSLEQQPAMRLREIAADEAFWFAQGFSQLDLQIHYQGKIKHGHAQEQLNFSVTDYAGGDEATNAELCHLYREAYKKRIGIPDISPEGINKQLSIPSCSYLIMRHNNELIGQCSLFISDEECYVDSIYVRRSYWGTGAADKLTQSLFDYAEKKGCQTVSGTAASNNQASRALMERFGLVAQYQVKRVLLSL